MRILGLDIGDRWVGSAISDPLGLICRPYETVERSRLNTFLEKTVEKENVRKIVIGLPTTLKGGESEQTKKVKRAKEELSVTFPNIEFVLWDERLSSKQAKAIGGRGYQDKERKIKEHSVAAALILYGYLEFLRKKGSL